MSMLSLVWDFLPMNPKKSIRGVNRTLRSNMKVEASNHQIHLLVEVVEGRKNGGWVWKKITSQNGSGHHPIVELLLGGVEGITEFMTPTPIFPTDGAN
jgi:hypothetical protein